MSDKGFDPRELQAIIDRLNGEGRMPSPKRLSQVMLEAKAEYEIAAAIAEQQRRHLAAFEGMPENAISKLKKPGVLNAILKLARRTHSLAGDLRRKTT
jgi:hypothetical protein